MYIIMILQENIYGTTQLQLHFYTRGHAWHHAVFCVLNAKISLENIICMLRDMAFPRDESYNLHETWSTIWRLGKKPQQ